MGGGGAAGQQVSLHTKCSGVLKFIRPLPTREQPDDQGTASTRTQYVANAVADDDGMLDWHAEALGRRVSTGAVG